MTTPPDQLPSINLSRTQARRSRALPGPRSLCGPALYLDRLACAPVLVLCRSAHVTLASLALWAAGGPVRPWRAAEALRALWVASAYCWPSSDSAPLWRTTSAAQAARLRRSDRPARAPLCAGRVPVCAGAHSPNFLARPIGALPPTLQGRGRLHHTGTRLSGLRSLASVPCAPRSSLMQSRPATGRAGCFCVPHSHGLRQRRVRVQARLRPRRPQRACSNPHQPTAVTGTTVSLAHTRALARAAPRALLKRAHCRWAHLRTCACGS